MNSSSSFQRRTTWDVSQRSSASSSTTMRDNRQRRRTSAPATTINIHQYQPQPSNTMMETASSSSDDDSNNSSYIRTDVSFISSNISIDTELAHNLFPVANRDRTSPQQYTYSHSDRSDQESSRGGSRDDATSTTSSSLAGASLQHDLPKHWTKYNETTITENTLHVPNLGTCSEALDEDFTERDVEEAYNLPSNRINRRGATSTTSGRNPLSESEQAYRALMSLMTTVATDGSSGSSDKSNSDKSSNNTNTHEQRHGGRLTCNTRRKSNAASIERRLSNQSSSFCRYGPPDNRASKSTDTLDADFSTSTTSTTTQRRRFMKKCIHIILITLVIFVMVSALVVYLVIENQEYGNTETENKDKDSSLQSTTTILEVLSNVFVGRFSSNDGTRNKSQEEEEGGHVVRDLYFENDTGWNDDEYREERVSLLFHNMTR